MTYSVHPIIRLDVDVGAVNFGDGLDARDNFITDAVGLDQGSGAIHIDVQVGNQARAGVIGHQVMNAQDARHRLGGFNDLLSQFFRGAGTGQIVQILAPGSKGGAKDPQATRKPAMGSSKGWTNLEPAAPMKAAIEVRTSLRLS